MTTRSTLPARRPLLAPQRGASLLVVMLILIVVSILGVGGAQIALMAERGARNDRDMQVAWQAAEAALIDAEIDLTTPTSTAFPNARGALFGMTTVGTPARNVQSGTVEESSFSTDCGYANTQNAGLCKVLTVSTVKPAWMSVDFTVSAAASARSVAFGQFTSRSFAFGSTGVQPAKAPRYIIEAISDTGATSRDKTATEARFVYRVTAMGFGPRDDIQAVSQMTYRN